MNNNFSGNSSHQTSNTAYKHHISTIDEIVKKALFLFKFELFVKVLNKDNSAEMKDYDFETGLRTLSENAMSHQKSLLEFNILSCDDGIKGLMRSKMRVCLAKAIDHRCQEYPADSSIIGLGNIIGGKNPADTGILIQCVRTGYSKCELPTA